MLRKNILQLIRSFIN